MIDKLNELSDFSKFIVFVIIYTGYLTWWASGVQNTISHNTDTISEVKHDISSYMITNFEVTLQATKLSENVKAISKSLEKHDIALENIVKEHAKCSTIMSEFLKRMDRLEGFSSKTK